MRIDDEWKEEKIVKQLDRPRSYEVEMTNGRKLERNRVKLKPNNSRHSRKLSKPVTFSDVCSSQKPRPEREGQFPVTGPAREGQFPIAWRSSRRDDDLGGGQGGDDQEGLKADPERDALGVCPPGRNSEEENDNGLDQGQRVRTTEGSQDATDEPHLPARKDRVKKKVRRLIEEI